MYGRFRMAPATGIAFCFVLVFSAFATTPAAERSASQPPLTVLLMEDSRWVRFAQSTALPSEQVQDLIELPNGDV